MNQKSKVTKWISRGVGLISGATSILITSQISFAEVQPTNQLFFLEEITKNSSQSLSGIIAQGGEEEVEEFKDILSGTALLNELRKGGYIIYFRHVQTEVDYADQITAKMGYCNTQRMLSEQGWQQARMIGQAFRDLGIPVGKVYSSEYCRAWQTADLAFGSYEKKAALNFLPYEEYTDAQMGQMKTAVMPFLTAVPESGKNTVIVGHDDIFEAATGIYPEPQGVAYILKPDGRGGFQIVANILPEEWSKLTR